jgi:hypothetical protein
MRIVIIVLFGFACVAPATPQGDTTATQAPQASVTSIPASSSCAPFDPTGIWTLASNTHDPQDFTLRRDNTVALDNGTLQWDWEKWIEGEPLQSCIVRFAFDFDGESCEYTVAVYGGAIRGYVHCCETGPPGEEIERAICNEFEVSGVARLTHPGGFAPE